MTKTRPRLVWGSWALFGLMVMIAGVIFMAVPLMEPPNFLATHPYIRDAGPPSALGSPRAFPQWGFMVLPGGGLYAVPLPKPCPSPSVRAASKSGDAVDCGIPGAGWWSTRLLPHLLIWIDRGHTYVDPTHTVDVNYRATPAP